MARTELALILGPFCLLISGLLVFSCVRDAVAIRALVPTSPPIAMPLHP
jgi:hypothetical protein